MCWLIHTHGPIEESHYAFRWLARTAKGDGLVQWNLQSEDLALTREMAASQGFDFMQELQTTRTMPSGVQTGVCLFNRTVS